MRAKIEKQLGILATENYGLSEVGRTGICRRMLSEAADCISQKTSIITEIVDPDTLEPLPMGEKGEVVITIAHKTGIPDAQISGPETSAWLNDEPCECGRTSMRMAQGTGHEQTI